jgi:hypothetical protein
MRFHRVAVLVLVSLVLLILAAPAGAARQWSIKNNKGVVIGSVHRDSREAATVFDQIGGVGNVNAADGIVPPNCDWQVLIYSAEEGIHYVYNLLRINANRWRVESRRLIAVRTSTRWSLKRWKSGKWARVASAPRGCPGQFALGAAFSLGL